MMPYMIVIDTNVLDAALRSPNEASRFILTELLRGNLAAAASTALLLEYEEVIKRPEHLAASTLSAEQVDWILSALASVLTPVYIRFQWRPTLPDPDDGLVLEAAINGMADTIVSFNGKDFKRAAEFGIEVLQPSVLSLK